MEPTLRWPRNKICIKQWFSWLHADHVRATTGDLLAQFGIASGYIDLHILLENYSLRQSSLSTSTSWTNFRFSLLSKTISIGQIYKKLQREIFIFPCTSRILMSNFATWLIIWCPVLQKYIMNLSMEEKKGEISLGGRLLDQLELFGWSKLNINFAQG